MRTILPMEPRGWTYMLASRRNGTLYVGSATDLSRRIYEHKEKLRPGFTSTYDVTILVCYEGVPEPHRGPPPRICDQEVAPRLEDRTD